MLSDFFRTNLPYGIARNENGAWMAFNREYLPLGYNDLSLKGSPGTSYLDLPVYSKYKRISDKTLIELADDESSIQRNESGEITTIFLYHDGTNPMNQSRESSLLWNKYMDKLKRLSRLKIKEGYFEGDYS